MSYPKLLKLPLKMKFKTTLIFTSLIFLSITTHAQSIEEQQVNKTMQDQMNLFNTIFVII